MAEENNPQHTARQYQLELLEYVTKHNAIIYLPTGAGKTFVAILALKRFSSDFNKTVENGGKRAIFMCKTVELARQQSVELRKHTSFNIGLYTGERGVDNWMPERWKKEIDENQVLVGTAQIFVDIVSRNIIKITDLNVVIIDECHHGTKKHAMHEFMRTFTFVSDTKLLPRVIGLTGVLLKGNKLNNVMEDLRNLEITFQSKIVTVSSREEFLNVLIHSTSPKEEWLPYESYKMVCEINESINLKIKNLKQIISEFDIGNHPIKFSKGLAQERGSTKKRVITKYLNEILYHLEEYGLYCLVFVLQAAVTEFEIKQRQAETIAVRRMYRIVIINLETIRHMIFGKFKDFIKQSQSQLNAEDCHQVEVILEYSTPKVIHLLNYIDTTFSELQRKDVACLIFVERRLTARSICNVIKRFVHLKQNLKETIFPEFIVGRDSNSSSVVENMIERKWNTNVLSDFRKGLHNMIICSNVLEEGIHIQACNYVIVLDPLRTFNAYIQTKGRARSKESVYVITTSKADLNQVSKQILKYQEISNFVQKFLIERAIERPLPNQDEIDTEFADKISPLIAPNGACLLASSALSRLNQYCQMLPWDIFGCLLPQFKKLTTAEDSGVIVSVQLPLQSRVKEEIKSDCMENVKMAKISAAIKACQRLYEEGELNEMLMPTSRADCVKLVSDVLFKHWEKYEDNIVSKKVGKARLRLYEMGCPDELYNAIPVVGEICYAYKIVISPEFEPNEYNNHVIEALTTQSKYALLLRKRLPSLAQMPLFMRQGSLKVSILDSLEFVITSEEELAQLRKHHLMIMRDLLQCRLNYYVEDSRNKQNSFLIVPLHNNEIDWETVQRFQRLKPINVQTLSERQNQNYRAEAWLGKTVAKWYTVNKNERFLVTKVLIDQTPHTKFTESDQLQCKSYLQYFECNYGNVIERVVNQTQFLIEVKPITARRNFFNNAKYKDQAIKRDTQKIILLPELCHNFEYPGDLYLQAIFLPSILHRIQFLLHAEQLRKRVNLYLGITELFNDYKPKPLIVDISLRRAVNSDENAGSISEKTPNLSSLTSSSSQKNLSFDNISDNIWKEYEEPINFARQTNIYPVELQYYHNFEQKWFSHPNMLDVADKNDDQLEKPTCSDKSDYSTFSSLRAEINDKYENIKEKCRIEILEQSFSVQQQSELLKSAEQHEFLAALTTSNANDVFDMERFELLGDSFLKFSMSLYLVNKFPMWHEGFLTEVKSKLVSNRNLLYCLLETDIPTRICSKTFSIDEWLPPLISLPANFLDKLESNPELCKLVSMKEFLNIKLDEIEVLSGHCNDEHLKEFMKFSAENKNLTSNENRLQNGPKFCLYKEVHADKIIADTLEALLGVCVKNYGIHKSFRMLEFFGLYRSENNDESIPNLLELNLDNPQLQHAAVNPSEIDAFLINYERLEINLCYKFRNRAYLLEALTHPSFPMNRLTGCYQRLEFIGDAILDFLVTCYIFERNRSMTPGELTDLRSALVNNITLGCICIRKRFHLFLLAENVALSELIQKFADFQAAQGNRVTDQVRYLMEEHDEIAADSKFNISQNVEVPKVLGDIVEALIAAVYLDSRCLHTTWIVIYRLLEQEINEFSQKVPIDPVRQLYEHPTAKAKFFDPVTDKGVTTVKCIFICMKNVMTVNGFGANKWQAKKAAAKHALRFLTRV